MKISERNMFGIKLFTQPVEPNTILTFIKQYHNLQKEKWKNSITIDKYDFDNSHTRTLGFELSILFSYSPIIDAFVEFINTTTPSKQIIPHKQHLIKLMGENINYLFRPECFEIANKIKLNNFSISYLRKLKTQKSTYLLDKNKFFRFYKTDSVIVGGLFNKDEDLYDEEKWKVLIAMDPAVAGEIEIQREFGFDYNLFRIDLINNYIEINDLKYLNENCAAFLEDSQYKVYKLFVQLLLFVCLSEPKIKILPPNSKIGKTKTTKVVNESKTEVVIVSNKWNQISVRAEGFKVHGHFRLQPCGKKLQDVKLIYIDTFQKHGYTRKSNKQLKT